MFRKVVAPPLERVAASRLGMMPSSPLTNLVSSKVWDVVMKMVEPRKLTVLSRDRPMDMSLSDRTV